MHVKDNLRLCVDDRLCLACGACVGVCAFNALTLLNRRLIIDHNACEACRFCEKTCPVDALTFVEQPTLERAL